MTLWLAMSVLLATAPSPATDDAAPSGDNAARAEIRVLLVATGSLSSQDALGVRLRRTGAELEAGGFETMIVALTELDGDVGRDRLQGLAAQYAAQAIVVFANDQVQAELWSSNDPDDVLDRIAVVVGDAMADDNDAVLAVRLTEVLQASLLDVTTAPRPVPAAHKPVPQPVLQPAPIAPRWAARVGLHAAGSAQRVGLMLGPTLGATLGLGPRRGFGLDLEAFSTALLGQVRAQAGRATVGLATARLLAQWWPLPAARISPALGIGMGTLLAWTRGSAVAPFTSRTDVTVVSLPTGAADLAIRLSPQLRLRMGIRVGVALPLIRIRAPETTTEVARPLFDGGLALELTPPVRGPRRGNR